MKECSCSRSILAAAGLVGIIVVTIVVLVVVNRHLAQHTSEVGEAEESEGSADLLDVVMGTTVYFTSPNYPHNYEPFQRVEWHFRAPPDGVMMLLCHDVQLSWFAELYVTDGTVRRRVTCYDCSQPTTLSHEFSGADAEVGLRNKLFYTGRGFNCSLRVTHASPHCNCGSSIRERIVGGTEAVPHSYPWMVGITSRGSKWIFCGGSLISDRHVLTVAHCTKNTTADQLSVSLGAHDVRWPRLRSEVLQVVTHPAFVDDYLDYDIALLRINPIDFSADHQIRPICLPSGSGSYEGKTGIVAGWGTTTYEGLQSPVLLEVPQVVLSNRQCDKYYRGVLPTMLCAGTVVGDDACQGDSGGPLFIHSPTGYEVIGLVSFGKECARGVPGVYTRVTGFLQWIEAETSDGRHCPPHPEL